MFPIAARPPAITDLLGGRIDMMLGDVSGLMPHVRAGKVTPLAVAAAERSSIAPEIPTMAEAGVPDMESVTWYAVFAPAGTPAARLARVHDAVQAALKDEQTREALVKLGRRVVGGTPDDLAAYLRKEYQRWGEVVRASGAKLP